jgi:tetratricopeptide (TPR) repeat protein
LAYQHELAVNFFLACLHYSPNAALAHGFVALCHAPNYNFKGNPYWESANHPQDALRHDLQCIFPSQQVAERHSKAAVDKIEEIRRMYRVPKKRKSGKKKGRSSSRAGTPVEVDEEAEDRPDMISEVEQVLLQSIRILTCQPGVDPGLADEMVGRPFAEAMKKVYERFPTDPEVTYFFAESVMVLNAWKLYDYPSGRPVSSNVIEIKMILEKALELHPDHAGLCHLFVHLSEMSATPEIALKACTPLRHNFPHAGHLIHMGTHIDGKCVVIQLHFTACSFACVLKIIFFLKRAIVLLGEYESCVRYNLHAIEADLFLMRKHPHVAEKESFYFGYIVHDFHMAVYGAILGGMEKKAMEVANQLNSIINESMFREYPDLVAYLEAYSALDIHIMVRFGRWTEILELSPPKDKRLMLFRSASLAYARGLALATMGDTDNARREADRLDGYRQDPEASLRILHNNSIAQLLEVDSVMMKGEIAYHEGKYQEAFSLLRIAVELQDNLNYDEPWGKMQPIRHALGGLLLEQGHLEEATQVFKTDLKFHPKNPWALVGLLSCLRKTTSCCAKTLSDEVAHLEQQLALQRQSEWADYEIIVSCECCKH